MRDLFLRAAIAGALVAVPWLDASQSQQGDFELRITTAHGITTMECLRGCTLIGERDVRNPRAGHLRQYDFSCDPPGSHCEARVIGFLKSQ